MTNLLTNLPGDRQDESFENLVEGGDFRAERIVSHGHTTPPNQWYDQATDEWVVLLSGAVKLRFENHEDVYQLRPGDYVNIPAHQRHRVEWTDPNNPTVWLAIHYKSGDGDTAVSETTG